MIKLIKNIIDKLFFYDDTKIFFKKYLYVKSTEKSHPKLPIWLHIKMLKYKIDIRRLERKHNCAISLKANIKKSTIFPHGIYGIFISNGAEIGENCVIFHQVTIGSNTLKDSKRKGAPVIGNNVYIGAGAKIIGNVKIGNNCRIGANCVVVKDIPDNSTVVLGECRIIPHATERDNKFYKYEK